MVRFSGKNVTPFIQLGRLPSDKARSGVATVTHILEGVNQDLLKELAKKGWKIKLVKRRNESSTYQGYEGWHFKLSPLSKKIIIPLGYYYHFDGTTYSHSQYELDRSIKAGLAAATDYAFADKPKGLVALNPFHISRMSTSGVWMEYIQGEEDKKPFASRRLDLKPVAQEAFLEELNNLLTGYQSDTEKRRALIKSLTRHNIHFPGLHPELDSKASKPSDAPLPKPLDETSGESGPVMN